MCVCVALIDFSPTSVGFVPLLLLLLSVIIINIFFFNVQLVSVCHRHDIRNRWITCGEFIRAIMTRHSSLVSCLLFAFALLLAGKWHVLFHVLISCSLSLHSFLMFRCTRTLFQLELLINKMW